MLVLSRKKGEEIVIGNGLITLVVVEIRGDKIRLGIKAPKDMPVHRKEVQDEIDASNTTTGNRRPEPAGAD
jgi:carbon storage regulator